MGKVYNWQLPIGDETIYGHGLCDWWIMQSNFTVDQAREAYWKAVKESGLDFAEVICAEYEDCTISKETYDRYFSFIPNNGFDFCDYQDEQYYICSDDLVKILMAWIKYYTPEFEARVYNIPTFTYYGTAKHICNIGYGVQSL